MGLFAGIFTYFLLSVKKMERLRVGFFLGMSLFVITTLTANILNIGFHSFSEWVRTWNTGYYDAGSESRGTTPFPLPILIPTLFLNQARFSIEGGAWESTFATNLDIFLVFMTPYIITFLVFGRGFCGWICPMGGLPEGMSTLVKKRRWNLKLFEKKASEPTGRSLTGLTGLKNWTQWVRFGIAAGVLIWSIVAPFAIVNIVSPALWIKSVPVFWTIIAFLIVFAVVLPFMTRRRWWCDVICPIGTGLALLYKMSLFRVKIDKTKCNECMDCVQTCRMYAMTPQGVEQGAPNSGNCITCGRCIEACPEEAIDISWLGKHNKVRGPFIAIAITAVFAWYLWFVVLLVYFSSNINRFQWLN